MDKDKKDLSHTSATLVSRMVTMPTNSPKSQKTSGDLDDLYVNNLKKRGIEMSILHLISL